LAGNLSRMSNSHPRKKSIVREFVYSLSLVLLLAAVFTPIFSIVAAQHETSMEMNNLADEHIREITKVLSGPIWNYNQKTIDAVVNAYLQNDIFSSIKIEDVNGAVLFDTPNPRPATNISRQGDVLYGGQIIARVSFEFSHVHFQAAKKEFTIVFGAGIFGLLVLVLPVSGLLMRAKLKKSLDGFAESIIKNPTSANKNHSSICIYEEFMPLVEELNSTKTKMEMANEELSKFFTLSFDMLCIADFKGRFHRLNPSWEDTLGYSMDEMIGRPFIEFVHPDDVESTIAAANKLAEGKQVVEFENRYRTKSGDYVWVLWNAISDVEAELIYATATNITSHKKYEETLKNQVSERTRELAAEKERAEHYLEIAATIIVALDDNGNISLINDRGCEVLGYSKDELIGKNWFDMAIPQADREMVRSVFKGIISGDNVSYEHFENTVRTKSGEQRIISWNNALIRGEDLKISGTLSAGQDITQERRAQEQLIQSSKMATLGEMATGVAHELNQPLSIIGMAAANIQRRAKNGALDTGYLADKVGKVVSQVERAAAIIDHMRIFGRKPSIETEALSPEKMIEGALSLIGEQLKLAGVEIKKDFATDNELNITGHQVQVEQVLLNLIANARDIFTDLNSEEKAIIIRTRNNPEMNAVLIEVEDTGGGIPDNIMHRIFEPFFTTKEVGKGTGLGLSISYGIIRDMGGEMHVRNGEKGAIFTISLPLAKDKHAA